jgi:2,4-dienoyl-CoA reductase-like NADH-dependent reductase (Old Yellow Enzyme family)
MNESSSQPTTTVEASGDRWVLDEPIQVGPLPLRGRVYVPAHQPGLAEDGQPGERYIAYQRARARAGVAMQVTGATPIAPSRVWNDICLWNVDESIVPGYRRLADAVHEEGGRMLAQLAHPGPTELVGPDVLGPSRDFSEVNRQVVRPATTAQLRTIVQQYAEAADRCRRGGLDGVEISMAHGLLLAAFLTPLHNQRDDEYGGSFERRLRLPIEVLDAVREAVGPDLAVGIRLGVDDLVDGGLRPADAARVAAALESRADYVSVMVGNNNRLEARVRHWPPTPAPFGLFRDVARTIKQAVSVPVAAVGRITTAALANDLVVAGDTDLVGMVRAHIADPDLLVKSRAGRVPDVRPCVGANVCVNNLLAEEPLTCLVNPDVGHESEPPLTQDTGGTRAVVVGAGPAGMEAARRLAMRGYAVTLFERADEVGGQVLSWTASTSRREVRRFLDWQLRGLRELGVDLRLGTEADADLIASSHPGLTVLATGARAAAPAGLRSDGSVRLADPLGGADWTGHVVVYDGVGELDGALLAERAAEGGADSVTLVTGRLHVGEGDGITTLFPMIRRLAELGVAVVERAVPSAASNGRVELTGVFGEVREPVRADTLVTWVGGIADPSLREELMARGIQPVEVGDALRPRRATDAVREGARCERTAAAAGVLENLVSAR